MTTAMLGLVEITPFVGAVLICWIFSVCVHEFAHAVVAYIGGDSSVRDRGYLSLNPMNYIDPVTSVLLPCVFLIMGGFPLPGGAVRIDRSALKSRAWESAVSAAGPASNFVLFMLIAGALHLSGGVENPNDPNQSIWVRLLGVLAVLQIFSVFLNLIPLPPFDGFGIIEPFFDDQTRLRIAHSPARWLGLVFVFFVLFQSKSAVQKFYDLMDKVIVAFGLPWDLTWRNFNNAFFGASQ